jgi:hypothetical protein
VKTYWGVEVWLYAFLTLALGWGDWLVSRPGRFTPSTHRIDRMGPRACLEKLLCSYWIPNPEMIPVALRVKVDHITQGSCDSSVGIALDYGLDDRGSRVRISAGTGNFSQHHRVQNGSGARPASYPMVLS